MTIRTPLETSLLKEKNVLFFLKCGAEIIIHPSRKNGKQSQHQLNYGNSLQYTYVNENETLAVPNSKSSLRMPKA